MKLLLIVFALTSLHANAKPPPDRTQEQAAKIFKTCHDFTESYGTASLLHSGSPGGLLIGPAACDDWVQCQANAISTIVEFKNCNRKMKADWQAHVQPKHIHLECKNFPDGICPKTLSVNESKLKKTKITTVLPPREYLYESENCFELNDKNAKCSTFGASAREFPGPANNYKEKKVFCLQADSSAAAPAGTGSDSHP
jgi:hypothetical protein